VETWIRVPEWSLAIDVGRAPERVARCKHLALTHAHMDHAGGLSQYLALRRLFSLGPSCVYAPADTCEELRTIIAAWERLHGVPFDWTLLPMRPGDEVALSPARTLRALGTHHVVPSLGYALLSRSRRLKPELAGAGEPEIRRLRSLGEEVTVSHERVLLAASGDTRVEAIDETTELRDAEIALIEATFLDGRRALKDAHRGGHIHLDEIIGRAEALSARHFVPYHTSQIYSPAEALTAIHTRLPAHLEMRTTALVPGERIP